jgi:hypothetical protein
MQSNVDELYRWELGLEYALTFTRDSSGATVDSLPPDPAFGWRTDRVRNMTRLSAFGTADGRRNAFVRYPDARAAIIILTSSDDVDARGIAERIAERLFTPR